MKTLGTVALTYFFVLVLSLFALLFVPRAYGAPGGDPSKGNYQREPISNRPGSAQLTPPHDRRPSGLPSHSTSSCRALVEELNAMKKAQNQMINSLAQNHDIFADQLSDLSFELALYKKTVPQKALESMEKSAQAYRVRSLKAQETAQRLDGLTTSLINRIQRCLK